MRNPPNCWPGMKGKQPAHHAELALHPTGLGGVIAIQHERVVNRDHTVQVDNPLLQIRALNLPQPKTPPLPRQWSERNSHHGLLAAAS